MGRSELPIKNPADHDPPYGWPARIGCWDRWNERRK
ncbi:MAG: hypothetical protein V7606_2040 [Burkholderiales bacterium]